MVAKNKPNAKGWESDYVLYWIIMRYDTGKSHAKRFKKANSAYRYARALAKKYNSTVSVALHIKEEVPYGCG